VIISSSGEGDGYFRHREKEMPARNSNAGNGTINGEYYYYNKDHEFYYYRDSHRNRTKGTSKRRNALGGGSPTSNKAELSCSTLTASYPLTSDVDPAEAVEVAAFRYSYNKICVKFAFGIPFLRMHERLLAKEDVSAGAGRAQVVVLFLLTRTAEDERRTLNDAVYR